MQTRGRGAYRGRGGRLNDQSRTNDFSWPSWERHDVTGDVGGRHGVNNEAGMKDTLVLPKSFAAWVIGVLGGQKNQWLMQYLQYPIFRETKKIIEKRTGLNVEWLIGFLLAANSMKQKIPNYASTAFQHVKEQTTSSVTIPPENLALQMNVLRFIQNLKDDKVRSKLSLRGQHEVCKEELRIEPRDGELKQIFWPNGTFFLLDEQKTGECHYDEDGDSHDNTLIIRCLGHSNEPIIELLKHIEAQVAKSQKLTVWKYSAGYIATSHERDKRPFDSVDLEPAMSKQIRQEVRDFFHEGSKQLYAETSRPYRHGMLFEGPPGTGKTSLAFACASEAKTPLVIIKPQGMDDYELEQNFAKLPTPCTVLLEDIDAFGMDVAKRTMITKTPVLKGNKKEQKISKIEAAEFMERTMNNVVQVMENMLDKGVAELRETQEAFNEDLVLRLSSNNKVAYQQGTAATKIKRVTLSGVLNVIDGASAVEGRLLIITTNHAEQLDDALARAGRCDSKFHIG